MVRDTRKERRRLGRLERRKQVSGERHREGSFLSTLRKLASGGWLGQHLRADLAGADMEETRRIAGVLCRQNDLVPGDPASWSALVETARENGAPLDVLLGALGKYERAHPNESMPRLLRSRYRRHLGGVQQTDGAVDPLAALREFVARRTRHERTSRLRGGMEGRNDARGSRTRTDGAQPPVRGERGNVADRPAAAENAAVRELDVALAFLPGCRERHERVVARLLRGSHDDLASVGLAHRGAELLAEDHYDRLLCLSEVQGVDHLGYQIETVLRVLKKFRGRVLLADEVGLGKTIEACLVLKEYLLRGQVKRALIVTPPALVGQWRCELAEKFGIEATTSQDAEFRADPEGFWAGGPVLIASLATARQAAHRELVFQQKFDIVIVDEAHHVKNRTTRSWELVNGLRSRFFLLLTATPVETRLTELYDLLTLLRPGTFGTETEFRRRFVRRNDPTRPRDAEKLREILREVMIRNTRAVSGVLLPPRTARTVLIEPEPCEKALYAFLLDAARRFGSEHRTLLRTLLEEAGSSPLAVRETVRRAMERGTSSGLRAVLEDAGDLSAAAVTTAKLERLAELLPGGKVLVFSRFRATLEWIAEDLSRRGIPFASFHGGLAASEKERAIACFASAGSDVLLASEIGGEGRNLQFCHRVVNFDLPWNPMAIEQRVGRVHRIGQTETVEVVNFAGKGTAEERILDVLDRRVNLFELVVGEMDLLLGDVEEEKEFGERVFHIYSRSRSERDIECGFDELANDLLEARRRLEKTKALDEELFGEGYEA